MVLQAQTSPVSRSMTLRTMPNWPSPSVSLTSYFSMMGWVERIRMKSGEKSFWRVTLSRAVAAAMAGGGGGGASFAGPLLGCGCRAQASSLGASMGTAEFLIISFSLGDACGAQLDLLSRPNSVPRPTKAKGGLNRVRE